MSPFPLATSPSCEAIDLLDQKRTAFYADVLTRLNNAGIEFLVGGGFAYACYSGVERRKKDLDIFTRGRDVPGVLGLLEAAGYRTEIPFPHWLGKIHWGEYFIDVIFGSGNGVARVDDLWFRHAVRREILRRPVLLSPPEEMIWQKAFVQERERFDGADVLHLLRALAPTLDWRRLLMRFGDHWPVLLSAIVLFDFVYPDQRDRVPPWLTEELLRRFSNGGREHMNHVCRGTLLSRSQYLVDLERFGYADARARPIGSMTQDEIGIWTAGADDRT